MGIVDELFADLPQIHVFTEDGQGAAPAGLWHTDRDCYEFIASRCTTPGTRTLETGVGMSTVLFALLGTDHTCVAPFPAEVQACVGYLDAHNISHDGLTLHVGWSEDVLPTLDATPLDLVLIDGGHAFPFPVIDWHYASARLRKGGIVVVDDRQLPAVSEGLLQFIDRDPYWRRIAATPKWCAYERVTERPMREGWDAQHERGMFAFPGPSLSTRAQDLARRVLPPLAKRLVRRLTLRR
jgi:hypothetical protein